MPEPGIHGYRPPIATLREIRETWDIGEVYAANDILDAMADNEYLSNPKRTGGQ